MSNVYSNREWFWESLLQKLEKVTAYELVTLSQEWFKEPL